MNSNEREESSISRSFQRFDFSIDDPCPTCIIFRIISSSWTYYFTLTPINKIIRKNYVPSSRACTFLFIIHLRILSKIDRYKSFIFWYIDKFFCIIKQGLWLVAAFIVPLPYCPRMSTLLIFSETTNTFTSLIDPFSRSRHQREYLQALIICKLPSFPEPLSL